VLERINEDFEFEWNLAATPLVAIYPRPGRNRVPCEQCEAFESFSMNPLEFIDRDRHAAVPNTVHARRRPAQLGDLPA
jgi:hypothetical protein